MTYHANPQRYEQMNYRRCGKSGLLLPEISLGLWHNFGGDQLSSEMQQIVVQAFDAGVTHFDLANNYGPPPGSAELHFGQILNGELRAHRDEIIVSSKAGWKMWEGPYGEWGSRKYLIASCDQSLRRMGLDYLDIFYSHRPDPNTPLEETMGALDAIVRSGKALYVGISSYSPEQSRQAAHILRELGTPCLIHQPRYSMFARDLEQGLLDLLHQEGMGCIGFSPLAQGILAGRYLNGFPADSRAIRPDGYLTEELVSPEQIQKVRNLLPIAQERNQSLAQLAIAWTLRDLKMTSTIIGARTLQQLHDNLGARKNLQFSHEELKRIDAALV